MSLLDIDFEKKEPIKDEDLQKLGFQMYKNGIWVYRVPFHGLKRIWVIKYYPRKTYNGYRARHPRLVFKDINYVKYDKQNKKYKYALIDENIPRVPQVVIKNPNLYSFETCLHVANQNNEMYTTYTKYLLTLTENIVAKQNYKDWLESK